MAGEPGQTPNSSDKLDRRKFMGLAATAQGGILIKPELVFGTAANSAVRVGLLGCGERAHHAGRTYSRGDQESRRNGEHTH